MLKRSRHKIEQLLIAGYDSLSQMTFRRKLPETVKFLEDELGAVILNGITPCKFLFLSGKIIGHRKTIALTLLPPGYIAISCI